MEYITNAPAKYVQGEGAIKKIAEYALPYGKKPFLILGKQVPVKVRQQIESSFYGKTYQEISFEGECCREEISRLIEKSKDCDVIVGIGGGKILDTAKAVGHYKNSPIVIVPTSASTDAPCSAISVLYTQEGVFEQYLYLNRSPDLVLVDSAVITAAPVRLFVSGMGDAIATYFEARACELSQVRTSSGGISSRIALILAKACFETLLEWGYQAKLDVENCKCTKAVEQVIEANIYLSGIGFESGGLAAAHAIHNGLSILSMAAQSSHGEKVAFGTLVQLILEEKKEEFHIVQSFCRHVGLPTTLEELGIAKITQEELLEVARASCEMNGSIYHMPMRITKEMVADAIKRADQWGRIDT